MRLPLLYRYLAREILSPFCVVLFVFTGILFLGRSLKLIELVVTKNVAVGDLILLFSYIIPRFLEVAIPMALLLSIIIAFGRLSGDSELVVMRSVGLSLKRLALPVFLFASVSTVSTLGISFWLRPWANHQLGLGLFDIASTQASAGLVSGVFNELGQLTVYAKEIENGGQNLRDVIIGDRRNPELQRIFIAQHGRFFSDKASRTITLQLFDGVMHEGTGQDLTVTSYETNSLKLAEADFMDDPSSGSGKKSSEMLIQELVSAISLLPPSGPERTKEERHHAARLRVELQKRLALPFSCVCVALIALALGIQPSRGGHVWGPSVSIGTGIAMILLYYLLFALLSAIGETSGSWIEVLLWIPNVIFAALGYYLFQRVGSESWMAVSEAIGDKIHHIVNRIRFKGMSA